MTQSVKRLLPASNQLICLDVLRLIASVTIIVYHFAGQLEFGPKQSPPTWIGRLNVAVDLFFLISGYVIIRFYGGISTLESYRSFLWKRLARLYPLHLTTALAFVAIGLAAVMYGMPLRLGSEQFNLSCLPANLLLIHSLKVCPYLTFNQASWSISAEMLLYLSLPLVLVTRRKRFLPPIMAVVGFVALWLAGPDGSVRPWFDRTYDYGVLRAAPSFLLGVAAYDHRHHFARIYRPEMSMWAVLVLVLGLAIAGAPGTLLVALLFISAACAIAADDQGAASRIARWLSPLGALTYSLYLLHPLIDIVFISFIGKKNLHLQGVYLNYFIIFAGLITFFAAYFSYVLFEDPARRVLLRLGGWRGRRAAPADSHTPL